MLQAPGRGAETRSRLIATNTPYIVRRAPRNGAKVAHYTTDVLHVREVDETRSTGRNLGGLFREIENTGRKIKGVLRVSTGRGALDGRGQTREHSLHVHTTPVEVKKQVRRVRPEENDLLIAKDADILFAETVLKTLRSERAELAATAWAKAHVVTVKELETLAAPGMVASYGSTEAEREAVRQVNADIRSLFANS